ncbi:MAG: hypothetical protein R3F30_12610 [Planctomycetota bacterium]
MAEDHPHRPEDELDPPFGQGSRPGEESDDDFVLDFDEEDVSQEDVAAIFGDDDGEDDPFVVSENDDEVDMGKALDLHSEDDGDMFDLDGDEEDSFLDPEQGAAQSFQAHRRTQEEEEYLTRGSDAEAAFATAGLGGDFEPDFGPGFTEGSGEFDGSKGFEEEDLGTAIDADELDAIQAMADEEQGGLGLRDLPPAATAPVPGPGAFGMQDQAASLEDAFDPEALEQDESYDPIYGQSDEPAYDEQYEEEARSYEHIGRIVGTATETQEYVTSTPVFAPRRSSWGRRIIGLGMAASILVLAAVGFSIVQPDNKYVREAKKVLGLEVPPPSIEVVRVDRPRIPIEADLPRVALGGGEDPQVPAGVTGFGVQDPLALPDAGRIEAARAELRRLLGVQAPVKDPEPLVQKDPEPTKDPEPLVQKDPEPTKDPEPLVQKDPEPTKDPEPLVQKDPEPTKDPEPLAQKDPEPTKDPEPLTQRDPTQVRAEPGGIAPGARLKITEMAADLARGVNALAQLRNGNFFVGRVHKVEDYRITLMLERGEISFMSEELKKLIPLPEQVTQALQRSPTGYVELRNENKLWGRILEDLPDLVTIETSEKHKISIPREIVKAVKTKDLSEIRVERDAEIWRDDVLEGAEDLPMPEVEEEPEPGSLRIRIEEKDMPKHKAR